MPKHLGKIVFLTLALTASAQAAIVYSGIQNLNISATFGGLFLDFDNPNDAGSFVTDPAGVSSSTTIPVPWDFNFFFGGAGIAVSDTASANTSGTGSLDPILNLPAGTILSSGDTFVAGFTGSLAHMGAAPGQFTSSAGGGPGGTEGYIGILLDPGSFPGAMPPPAAPLVGWIRVTLEDDGSVGIVHDWAWETTEPTIEVGAIPEPGNLVLLMVAALAIGLRKRRRS